MKEPCCKECKGRVILIEGWSLEAVGYGYGTFKCLKCKKESSYYGEGLIFPKIKERRKSMIKKTKRFLGDLWEKIFKRKELQKFKTQADLLEKEVEEKESIIEGQASQLRLLKSGDAVSLTHHEVGMIINAIEHKPFRDIIELPVTKAQTRIIWRDLRRKLKLHLKEEPVKEDDETKEA